MRREFFIVSIFFVSNIYGCGKECYDSPERLKSEYYRCSDLGISFSGRIKQDVWTFACTTSGDDVYADFVNKNGKLCRTYAHDY